MYKGNIKERAVIKPGLISRLEDLPTEIKFLVRVQLCARICHLYFRFPRGSDRSIRMTSNITFI